MSRILFIGGTRFVGRAMVEAALARGHDVTLFHRGQSGADLFPGTEHVLGDRNADLGLLQERSWDVVVDVAGFAPSVVRKSVTALRDSVKRYAFVSSISVHTEEGDGPITEASPLQQMPSDWDGQDETVTPESYGALKALCESEVIAGFGGKALLFRPGLVVGPNDATDRFTSWVRTGAQATEVDIPTTQVQPVQFTDARDLGQFMIHLIEEGWNGTVNATGPVAPLTFGQMWQTIQETMGRQVQTHWDTEGTAPLPCAKGFERFMSADNSKAVSLGLTTRPLEETVRDTWAWDQERGLPELSVQPSRFKKSE